MRPVLVQIGSFSLMSYTVFMILGIVAALMITYSLLNYRNIKSSEMFKVFIVGSISVFIGARTLNVYLNIETYIENPAKVFTLDRVGFSLYGGLILAAITVYIYSRVNDKNPYDYLDVLTPGLGFALMLMRMGCFLNGCCYGHETDLPWGIAFPRGQLNDFNSIVGLITSNKSPIIHYHPTQIYEALGGLIIGIACYVLIRKNVAKGIPTMTFILTFTLARWGNYYLRIYPGYMESHLSFYPILYLIIVLYSVYRVIDLSRRKRNIHPVTIGYFRKQ